MTKNELLDELFAEWIQENPKYTNIFKKDGVIDEDKYVNANTQILFIAKEANDNGIQKKGDFRKWWNETFRYQFSIRLGEWAYGVLYDFPDYSTVAKNDKKEALRSVAFMNLKKSGGTAYANYRRIEDSIKDEADLIKREIEIINPKIIVGCFANKEWWKLFLPEVKFSTKTIDGVSVGNWGNVKVIDFFHPSYRGSSAMSYAFLRHIFNKIKDTQY